MSTNTKDNNRKRFSIKLLDCTLRDGGHVNNWDFGESTIKKIISHLSEANIDIIELGLLKDVAPNSNSTLQPAISQFADLVHDSNASSGQYYTAMIRPDWIEKEMIEEYALHSTIKGLRFAFYPEDIDLVISQASYAQDRGYDIYLNAVGVSGYSQNELITTIKRLSSLNPQALSIVDTFGTLDHNSLICIYNMFEEYADKSIELGLHLHENRSLAYSLACEYATKLGPSRSKIIDASLFGMGRIPGNLCIEQIAYYLNDQLGCSYNTRALLTGIEECIYPIRQVYSWGYSPEYLLSAHLNVNRNYAEFFANSGLPINRFEEALIQVRHLQGTSFRYREQLAYDVLSTLQ
jgi:4-hydroxy 2-oxovalerate aldolase